MAVYAFSFLFMAIQNFSLFINFIGFAGFAWAVGGKALMCLDGFLDFNVWMGLRAGCYGWLDPAILLVLSVCLAKLSVLPAVAFWVAFCCCLVMLLIVVDYAADTGVWSCLDTATLVFFIAV
jgi:hypothetical protein